MKTVIIIIALIAVVCAVIEIVSRVVARREKGRFDNMSPEEQRKYQEDMYKHHQMG
jgi:hypothetical protein